MTSNKRIRTRQYCFTINNPKKLLDLSLSENIRYCIYSEEIGENGTNHFQGYLQLFKATDYNTIIQNYKGFKHASFRNAYGSLKQNQDYCSKQDETHLDGPYIYGEPVSQGQRSDLLALTNLANKGASFEEIRKEYPAEFIKFHSGIQKYVNMEIMSQPFTPYKPIVRIIYGPPGCGKTEFAMLNAPDVYKKGPGNYWGLFRGQNTLVLDDFKGTLLGYQFLSLTDHQYIRDTVEVKGSDVPYHFKEINITSNYHPSTWYTEKAVQWESLSRRICEWRFHFPGFEPKSFETYLEFENYLLEFYPTWAKQPDVSLDQLELRKY